MLNRRDAIRLTLGAATGLVIVNASGCKDVDRRVSVEASVKTLATRFSRHFELKHPFVCAGMAFVCDTSDLAVAVSRAGGVGCLAGTLLSPPTLAARIDEIKAATDGLFHVNFLTPFPHGEQVAVCIEAGVPIVSFHWGFPSVSTVSRLHAAGTSVWAQVGSVEGAVLADNNGADCIIAQGSEAGGHNYASLPLTSFLPAVRDALRDEVLLLGAGGISDGRTAAAVFAAGADGLWVGTRMVATPEANAHSEHKKRLVEARGEDTVLTSVYGPEMPGFNPIRVVRNATTDKWGSQIDQLLTDRSGLPSIGTTIFAEQERDVKPFDSFSPVPETTGDFDQMPIMSGQGVGLITDITPADEVISTMMNDAATTLQRLPA